MIDSSADSGIAHAAEPHEAEFGVLGREPKKFHADSSVVRVAFAHIGNVFGRAR